MTEYETFEAHVRCPKGHGDRKVTVTADSAEFYCHTCGARMYGVTMYEAYVEACEAENLDPLTQHMWQVHGRPEGPLGPETEFVNAPYPYVDSAGQRYRLVIEADGTEQIEYEDA